jgi:ubiquinone/menaquinone biosynthesis C-methylase UbiE
MNYDDTKIPQGYDRARDHGPAFLQQWMDVVGSHASQPRIIVDVGCGTGRFTQGLAERFNCKVIGIDPSEKMLGQAQSKLTDARVWYARGTGESIPLDSNIADLIFMSMVFHHFLYPAEVARECIRVLRAGGRVCLRTASSEQISSYPYVPFFPTSPPILEQRLPSLASQCAAFEGAGFVRTFTGIVIQQIASNDLSYADKLEAGGDSVLASLKPEDFAAGLKALRAAARDRPVVEPIDFVVFEKP